MCGLIAFKLWGEEKVSLIPWAFVDAFTPFDEALRQKDLPFHFLVCRGSQDCTQVWNVPEKGVGSIQSNIVRHVSKHLPTALLEGSKDVKNEDNPTQYEFVARWLASGLPHYQVTRASPSGLYKFLQSRIDCPVSSQVTFDKCRDTFLEKTVINMHTAMRGKMGFILGDSTPDCLKREWISFGATFIDLETLSFHYMPLGLNQAKGRLTEVAYSNHHEELCDAWEMAEYLRQSGDELIKRGEAFVIVGGGSDMGPGLRQVYTKRFGGPVFLDPVVDGSKLVMFAPCAAHGVTNITLSACSLGPEQQPGDEPTETSPRDYLEECRALLTLLQKRCSLESIQAAVGVPFPCTFRNKKWTSLKEMLWYFLSNWPKFMCLSGSSLDLFTGDADEEEEEEEGNSEDGSSEASRHAWNWISSFNMLSVFAAVMEPLCTLSVSLQKAGPLDGYVMVTNVVKSLGALHQEDFRVSRLIETERDEDGRAVGWEVHLVQLVYAELNLEQKEVFDSLKPCVELMKTRLVRRFFYNSLGSSIGRSYNVDGLADKTYKYDYFQNTTVLSLFAMSSDADFAFLRAYGGIATEEEIATLERRSKDALWALNKSLFGLAKPPEPPASTPSPSSSATYFKRARKDYIGEGLVVSSEAEQRQEFFVKVAQLSTHPLLKAAQMRFDDSGKFSSCLH